jgi:uncharacterized protein
LETLLVKAGFSVYRFNFPYVSEGRKLPDKMPVLVQSYQDAVAQVMAGSAISERIILAGHSLGGRVATHLASEGFPCAGLILFSYPLHPPGKPEKLRREHLKKITIPVLSLSGTCDTFCTPDLMAETVHPLHTFWTHHWLKDADHGLQVLKRSGRMRQDILTEARDTIANFFSNQDSLKWK